MSRVTVVIPAFDAARTLGAALASVGAQTEPAAEVLVVDDGSTDGTAEIAAAHPGVRILRQSRRGAGAARNRGVREAHGDLVAFLDADDLFLPGKLALQRPVLAADPELAGAFGRMRHELTEPALAGRVAVPDGTQPGFVAGALLVRRDAFLATGGFDESLAVGEFVDWYDRARHAGLRFARLDEVVLVRRIHGGNLTLRERERLGGFTEVARRAIARRRGEPP